MLEVLSSGVRASTTIVRIRKFYKVFVAKYCSIQVLSRIANMFINVTVSWTVVSGCLYSFLFLKEGSNRRCYRHSGHENSHDHSTWWSQEIFDS